MLKLIVFILSYTLGSIPFGLLVAYWVKKIDIRAFGSGNIGATNVTRVLGKRWGVLVFFLDFLKGVTAPILAAYLLGEANNCFIIFSVIFVVCGHNWTIFLKFKGGKGVATSFGGVAGLGFIFPQLWITLIISFIVWAIVFYAFKYISIASLAAAGAFFISSLLSSLPIGIKVFSLLLFIFIIIRHKKNIKNLFAKKEKGF